MTAKHAALALALAGATLGTATGAKAQSQGPRGLFSRFRGSSDPSPEEGAPSPFAPSKDKDGAMRDPKVFPASASLPTPTPPDQLKPATIPLPDGPVEPYLLTKDIGPFLVMAKTFRGPEAERFALALVLELRNEYNLPAFILRTKDFPNRSMIRNVPPTAPAGVMRPELSAPEKYRSFDEAVVLVGNEKTEADARKLLHDVKKLKPKCLQGMPHLFQWRDGLSTAYRTFNPLVPAQNIYSGRRDPLVVQMNEGPRTVFHCPGRYTLQIAQFSGRSTFQVDTAKTLGLDVLKRSPLATAHEDAEKLAEALARTPEIQKTGQPVYVYHDRTSSRVYVGSFQSDKDPAAAQLHDYLVRNATAMMDRKATKTAPARKYGVNMMIAPGTSLTDLETIKATYVTGEGLAAQGK